MTGPLTPTTQLVKPIAMSTGLLEINLGAVVANWRALDRQTGCETGAVVKADGYGLGAKEVGKALVTAGARKFFVAVAEEGLALRRALGPDVEINVFSGHMAGDTELLRQAALVPMLSSAEQIALHFKALPGHPFGVQLDSGMNRLGLEPVDWQGLSPEVLAHSPRLIMSHLACADEPEHPMNAAQRACFLSMTEGLTVPRSLAATGGLLLGEEYHFDLCRPGVGLYGGLPFARSEPVVTLDLPVVQLRDVQAGETVGYANSWQARRLSRIATVSGGYADGLLRALGSGKVKLWSQGQPCPVVGRISMDLITVDVTDLPDVPDSLQILGAGQSVDDLAGHAGTIGYEILTSLGARYQRRYRPCD